MRDQGNQSPEALGNRPHLLQPLKAGPRQHRVSGQKLCACSWSFCGFLTLLTWNSGIDSWLALTWLWFLAYPDFGLGSQFTYKSSLDSLSTTALALTPGSLVLNFTWLTRWPSLTAHAPNSWDLFSAQASSVNFHALTFGLNYQFGRQPSDSWSDTSGAFLHPTHHSFLILTQSELWAVFPGLHNESNMGLLPPINLQRWEPPPSSL